MMDKDFANRFQQSDSAATPPGVAAYHEAGHTVLAAVSRYHSLVENISIEDAYGAASVSLSKSKLQAAGKLLLIDSEIATEAAVIFLAGFAAENLVCQQIGESPDPELSKNDWNLAAKVLDDAGISTPIATVQIEANRKVELLWPVISAFADELGRRKRIDAHDAIDFIQQQLSSLQK